MAHAVERVHEARGQRGDRVREILGWYGSDNPGTLANLARLMNHGRLAGTGRFVILPVDQGFEHGPVRSFGPVPPARRRAVCPAPPRSLPVPQVPSHPHAPPTTRTTNTTLHHCLTYSSKC